MKKNHGNYQGGPNFCILQYDRALIGQSLLLKQAGQLRKTATAVAGDNVMGLVHQKTVSAPVWDYVPMIKMNQTTVELFKLQKQFINQMVLLNCKSAIIPALTTESGIIVHCWVYSKIVFNIVKNLGSVKRQPNTDSFMQTHSSR